jgi:hypothetical protein
LKRKYATSFNAKRADINATVFRDYLQKYNTGISKSNIPVTAIVIKAGTKPP